MNQTEQLERESELARRQLAHSLDDLRARITPGHALDEFVNFAQESSGGEFFRNLKDRAVSNPLPVTLMGAGLAWLMLSNGGRQRENTAAKMGRSVSDTAQRLGETIEEGSTQVIASVGDAASSARSRIEDMVGSTASSAKESAKQAAASTYEAASRAADVASRATDTVADGVSRSTMAMADSVKNATRNAAALGQNFVSFCRDQPLVLAGMGVAIGAALGAMLPETEAEDRLMGEASDKARESMKKAVTDTSETAKDVGESGVAAAEDEAQRRGFIATPQADQPEMSEPPLVLSDEGHVAGEKFRDA